MKQTRDDEVLKFAQIDVKCVTGYDAKEVGKEQPASYMIPQMKSVYAKAGADAPAFCVCG